MRVLTGNKLENKIVDPEWLHSFEKVAMDLGTGDGRFIYKRAIGDPNTLYIGVDSSRKSLEIYAKKSVRDRLLNVLFVVDSLETMTDEFTRTVDELYIILPWGSLLKHLVHPTPNYINKLFNYLKPTGRLIIILGYTADAEPSEVDRLDLETLTSDLINTKMGPLYKAVGFRLVEIKQLDKKLLHAFESTWCKRLSFGNDRPIFYLEFSK